MKISNQPIKMTLTNSYYMIRTSWIMLVSLLFMANPLQAQDLNMTYNRIGLTYVNLTTLGYGAAAEYDQLFSNFTVRDRYDDNRLSPDITLNVRDMSGGSITEKILNAGIPYHVVNKLFDNQDGKWSMDKLFERAAYNLTDAEVITLKNSFRGVENGIQDAKWSEVLLQNNYILAFEMRDFKNWKMYYDDIDAKNRERAKRDEKYEFTPVERKNSGYGGKMVAHIFKIKLDEEMLNHLYTNCWADENSTFDQIQAAEGNRVNTNYELIHMGTVASSGSSSSNAKTVAGLVNGSFNGCIEGLSNTKEEFQVKSTVYAYNKKAVRSIDVKIGKKEGVTNERRYFVYEQVAGPDGQAKLKRMGSVRAKNVIDNRSVASGNTTPSEFIQVSGGTLSEGMLVQEKPNAGAYLSYNYGNRGHRVRLEYLFSKNMPSPAHGWVLYFEGGGRNYAFDNHPVVDVISSEGNYRVAQKTDSTDNRANVSNIGFGIGKEIHLAGRILIQPQLGIRIGGVQFKDSILNERVNHALNQSPKAQFIINDRYITDPISYDQQGFAFDIGVNVGIVLAPAVQLVGSFGYSPVGTSKGGQGIFDETLTVKNFPDLDGTTTVIDNPYYVKRTPFYNSFGVRFCF